MQTLLPCQGNKRIGGELENSYGGANLPKSEESFNLGDDCDEGMLHHLDVIQTEEPSITLGEVSEYKNKKTVSLVS